MKYAIVLLFLSSTCFGLTAGNTATSGTDDSGDANFWTGAIVWIPGTGSAITVTGINIYSKITTGSGNVGLALYNLDGSLTPTTVISGASGSFAISNTAFQYNSVSFSKSLTDGTSYYAVWNTDNNNVHVQYNSLTNSEWQVSGQAYGSFPAGSAPAGSLGSGWYQLTITYTSGGGTTSVANGTLMQGSVLSQGSVLTQ